VLRRTPLAVLLLAACALSAHPRAAPAQTLERAPSSLLSPQLDGDAGNPPRFGIVNPSRAPARFRQSSNLDLGIAGGAGAGGFDSGNVRRRKGPPAERGEAEGCEAGPDGLAVWRESRCRTDRAWRAHILSRRHAAAAAARQWPASRPRVQPGTPGSAAAGAGASCCHHRHPAAQPAAAGGAAAVRSARDSDRCVQPASGPGIQPRL
jgi:hypothetical protein